MPPNKRSLDKYMPPVLGWDRLKPLPYQFTACPDPLWKDRDQRLMIIDSSMEPLVLDGRPTVIDLFAGAGGFSLGFVQAGWRVIASVEMDYWAHVTYCSNIPHVQEAPLHCYSRDIRTVTGREILLNAGIHEVDCIIGGPPCPSFSYIGKRKVGDPRDSLLWEFGRLIKEIQPRTWTMENVPGLKTKKLPNGKLVMDEFMKYMNDKTASDLWGIMIGDAIKAGVL